MMREIEAEIDLKKHGRKVHNGRPYLIKAVQRIIASDDVQEALKLGELYGYFGHGFRALTDKLNPDEMEVVSLNGQKSVISSEPLCITTKLSCSDDGIVRFTQRILDTDSGIGRKVIKMIEAGAGGWSWATSGDPQNIKGFGGFDYVLKPSYISRSKIKELMLESVDGESNFESEWLMLESVAKVNQRHQNEVELSFENLMLESMNAELQQRENNRSKLMLEAVESLPLVLSESQKNAFINCQSSEDVKQVKMMFESLSEAQRTLPSLEKVNAQKTSLGQESKDEQNDFGADAVLLNFG